MRQMPASESVLELAVVIWGERRTGMLFRSVESGGWNSGRPGSPRRSCVSSLSILGAGVIVLCPQRGSVVLTGTLLILPYTDQEKRRMERAGFLTGLNIAVLCAAFSALLT